MKIAIGADHRGFAHKEYIRAQYTDILWTDVGAYDNQRSDYPLFSHAVCSVMQSGSVDKGILLCATGVGMAIAANRFAGIYAAVAWNAQIARLSVEHDKVNLLVLPADYVSSEQVVAIIDAWLAADFLGDRYQKRVDLIDALGGVVDPRDTI
jgi:ribose 5-phosphate isomerase B